MFFKVDEKPGLADYWHWELVSGSGQFANTTGVGTPTIESASMTDRRFTLGSQIGPRH